MGRVQPFNSSATRAYRVLQAPLTVFQWGNRSRLYLPSSYEARTVRDASWLFAVAADGIPGWGSVRWGYSAAAPVHRVPGAGVTYRLRCRHGDRRHGRGQQRGNDDGLHLGCAWRDATGRLEDGHWSSRCSRGGGIARSPWILYSPLVLSPSQAPLPMAIVTHSALSPGQTPLPPDTPQTRRCRFWKAGRDAGTALIADQPRDGSSGCSTRCSPRVPARRSPMPASGDCQRPVERRDNGTSRGGGGVLRVFSDVWMSETPWIRHVRAAVPAAKHGQLPDREFLSGSALQVAQSPPACRKALAGDHYRIALVSPRGHGLAWWGALRSTVGTEEVVTSSHAHAVECGDDCSKLADYVGKSPCCLHCMSPAT